VEQGLPLSLVADVFERDSGVPVALQRLGIDVSVAALPSGDYKLPGGILVERKTVPDLHGSIERGRFFRQIGRLRDEAAFPYLLVEGANVLAGPCNPNGIRGALLAVADLGVALIRSLDVTDTSLWLQRLAVREQRRIRAVEDTANRLPDPGVVALAGVAGISRVMAKALLARFGSIEGLVAAGPKRWIEVEGIGEVRANALAAALLGPVRRGTASPGSETPLR
jgi:Fanconi anemia group M protein